MDSPTTPPPRLKRRRFTAAPMHGEDNITVPNESPAPQVIDVVEPADDALNEYKIVLDEAEEENPTQPEVTRPQRTHDTPTAGPPPRPRMRLRLSAAWFRGPNRSRGALYLLFGTILGLPGMFLVNWWVDGDKPKAGLATTAANDFKPPNIGARPSTRPLSEAEVETLIGVTARNGKNSTLSTFSQRVS